MLRLACNKNKEIEKPAHVLGLADNKDTDQHAHSRTMIWTLLFATINRFSLEIDNPARLWFGLITKIWSRPRWLSWMRRPTGDQEVAGSTPAEVGNILSWRLIMKYFLRSFSPLRWFKKGSCQFLAKECAQYWLTA